MQDCFTQTSSPFSPFSGIGESPGISQNHDREIRNRLGIIAASGD
jgi:hypothetical protein